MGSSCGLHVNLTKSSLPIPPVSLASRMLLVFGFSYYFSLARMRVIFTLLAQDVGKKSPIMPNIFQSLNTLCCMELRNWAAGCLSFNFSSVLAMAVMR